MDPVPLFNLRCEHEDLLDELRQAFERVLAQSSFILGHEVERFETHASQYLGAAHAVGVSSGSDALYLALRALGVGPGDEVITSALSFVATAEAILRCGATPVFADIDPVNFGLCPVSTAGLRTAKTRAVLYVHLYGNPGNIESIAAYCAREKLWLVEDACQAFGARVGEQRVGTFGDCGVFSFFPTKPLGGLGDGGLFVTKHHDLAKAVRSLRSHGIGKGGLYETLGGNFRLDGVQAALLDVKLKRVDDGIEARSRLASRYSDGLEPARHIRCPEQPPPPSYSAWSLYTICVAREREALQRQLSALGIETKVYYATLLSDQPLMQGKSRAGDLTRSRRASYEVLSLPLFSKLKPTTQAYVIEQLIRLTHSL